MTRILAVSLFLLAAIHNNAQSDKTYTVQGRAETSKDGVVSLIGSASSVSFNFRGNKCSVSLKSAENHHNYVSLELDGAYVGRYKIDPGAFKNYNIPVKSGRKQHTLRIFKATEASNGAVLFNGTSAESVSKYKIPTTKKVEFIGNSITCGFGNDAVKLPCGQGEWWEQHNAYWAYGPILSRALHFDFVLSSVSGIGIYRNWNDEHQQEAIMPEVYENLYLNKDASKKFGNSFQPDIVSICLGTNDLSDGDGQKPRLPFNEKKYVSNYIDFIKTVYKRYPNTRIVLLTSPMISGAKHKTFVKCLKEVIGAFSKDNVHRPIQLFEYKPMTPKGCGNHPDIDDHIRMAGELEPFFKKLLAETQPPLNNKSKKTKKK